MEKAAKILKKPITSTLIAVVCGFLIAGVIIALMGYSPMEALGLLIKGVFSRPKYIFKVIEKSTPLILTGVSVAFAFRTGLFNIGAEGQYIVGSVAATVVGIKLSFPPIIQIPVVIFAGILAGAIFGVIVGFLKARFGIHEVITGIMLNWVALYLCNFVVNSHEFNKPSNSKTYSINQSGYTTILYNWKSSKAGIEFLRNNKWLSDILLKTDVNVGFLVAILVAVLVWFMLNKTTIGFGVRAVGLNPFAAEFAGIGVKRHITTTMAISGSICGLAAALTITGTSPHGLYLLTMFENVGFNGLFVALIAGSSPISCIFSGLFFGGLIYGGNSIQSGLGVPSEIINITIGTILFFVALTKVVPEIANRLAKRRENNA
ncbi:MAG: general nucleoside transport system permease protein [Eubacteriales bacterium SKADARSKE-1]|nr:general nucleoside transport system permease protein [Eubacteriales bacterium SKADARSKE-1]